MHYRVTRPQLFVERLLLQGTAAEAIYVDGYVQEACAQQLNTDKHGVIPELTKPLCVDCSPFSKWR